MATKYKIHTCSECGHKERRPLTASEIGSKGGSVTGDKKRRPSEHYVKMQAASAKKRAENNRKNNENKI